MSESVKAADALAQAECNRWHCPPTLDQLDIERERIDDLRRACGWDGTGPPPAVVIRSDGTLAVLTQEFPPTGGLSLRAVTTEGSE